MIRVLIVFAMMYGAFIFKWGIGTGSIVMGAFLIALAIGTGAISLFKRK